MPITESMALTGSVYNLLDSRYEFLDGQPAPGISFRVGARMELGMGGGEVGR